jgi:hypothetical protein
MDKLKSCDFSDIDNPSIDEINLCFTSLLTLSCKDYTDYANNIINQTNNSDQSIEPSRRREIIAMLNNMFVETINVINNNTKLISNLMKIVLTTTENLNCGINTINNNPNLKLSDSEKLPLIDLSSVNKDITELLCDMPKSSSNLKSITNKLSDTNSTNSSNYTSILGLLIIGLIIISIIYFIKNKKKSYKIINSNIF